MAELLFNFHDNSLGETNDRELFVFGTPGEQIVTRNNDGFEQVSTLNSDGFALVKIPFNQRMIGTGVNNLGFQITSDGDIAAYFSNRALQTTDLTIVLDKSNLGTGYILASTGFANGEGGQFSVQATEDNTEINVTLPDGQRFSQTINAGQTFKFATGADNSSLGITLDAGFDLTGTLVSTSKPTAVFSGHDCTNIGVGFCDHLVEQMPPLEDLSTSYIVGEAFSPNGDGNNLVRVIATKPNTQVTVNGEVVATLNAQEVYNFVLSDNAAIIDTTQPVLIAQYLQGGTTAGEGDPAMMFVPGQEAWLSAYRLATPADSAAFAQNLVNVVIPTTALDSLRLNEAAVDTSGFVPVAGSDFRVGNVNVPTGVFSIEASERFQVSLFGFDNDDSYLTFGAAAFATGVSPTVSIGGSVWSDLNGNGIQDETPTAEPLLPEETVYIDENNNDSFDAGEPFQVTDTDGRYLFEDLLEGTYTVRTVTPQGAELTTPADDEYTLTLAPGDSVEDINFGRRDIQAEEPVNSIDGLDIIISAPSSIGATGTDFVTVTYVNRSEVALTAPLLNLSAEGAEFIPIGGTEFIEDSIQFLGINDEGLAGVLPVGASNSFRVAFQPIAGAGDRIDFSVSTVDPEETIDWSGLEDTLQPDYVTDSAWDAIYSNFIASVGTTAGDYQQLLVDNANYLSEQGDYVTDASRLIGSEFQQASDYQSLTQRYSSGSFGQGRFFIGDIQANTGAEGNVSIVNAGTQRSFTRLEDGTYGPATGDYGTLTVLNGAYTLTEQSGTATVFNPDGTLNFIEDTNGNRITGEYSGGQLMGLVATNGDRLTLARNPANQITAVTDSTGRTTTYEYTGDLLRRVESPDGITSYTYYDNGALQSITDGNGTQASFEYDSFGRLTKENFNAGSEAITYTYGDNGEVTVTDADGAKTQLFLNDRGQVTQLTDALDRTLRIRYDDAGNATRIIAPDGSGLTFTYDNQGNLKSQENALGQRTSFIYEPNFESLARVTDPKGNALAYDYDGFGNLKTITYADGTSERFDYDDEGNVLQSLNRRGQETTYSYSPRGQLLTQDNADGSSLTYTYDDRGNLATATDASGTTTLEYDAADRLTRITYANGRSLAYTYDLGGRRRSMTDGDGNQVNYNYDTPGRLSRLTDGDGNLIVAYEYDDVGRLKREDNGNGTYTVYEYDLVGQLESITNYAPDSSVNSSYSYDYDDLGQQQGVTTLDGSWVYDYDAIGQLTRAVFTSTNPDIPSQDLSYEYDAAGNRVRTIVNGETTDYTTNTLNQYESAGTVVYDYDDDGNLISKTENGNTWTYDYNTENRLVRVVDGNGVETRYEYDALGNRTATIHDGQRTEYLIDPFGLGDVVAEYDGSGGLISRYTHGIGLVNRDDGTTNAFYDSNAIGSTVGLTDATGTQVNSYSYRPFGDEFAETESITNPFEFVGQWGVMEEANGLDFMRARFFDSNAGRFVSMDPIGFASGDTNLYRYAFNIPNTLVDPSGEIVPLIVGGAITGALFNTAFSALNSLWCGEIPTGRQLAGAAIGGALGGAIGGIAGPLGGTIAKGLGRVANGYTAKVSTAVASGIGGFVGQEIADFVDPSSTAIAAGTSVLGGAASTAISTKGVSTLKQTRYFGPKKLNTLLSSPNGRRITGSLATSAIVAGIGNFVSGCSGNAHPDIEPQVPTNEELDNSSTNIDTQERTPTAPDNQARSKGEPHLTTFDGVGYSFQGAGEFTLVESLDNDLTIQVRYVEIDSRATVASAVATLVDGQRVVIDSEGIQFVDGRPIVTRSGSGVAKVTVDGEVVDIPSGGSITVGNSQIFRERGEKYRIVYAGDDGVVGDGDDQLIVDYLRPGTINIVDVALGDEKKGRIQGLLGNLNDNPDDDVALPDGTVLDRPLQFTDLYGDYREAWRIKDAADSLFDYEPDQGPETFYNPNFPINPVGFNQLDPASQARGMDAARQAGYQFGTFEFFAAAFDFAITGEDGFLEGLDTDPGASDSLTIIDDRDGGGLNPGNSTNPNAPPASFIGSEIQSQYYFPDLDTPLNEPVVATVSNDVEFDIESTNFNPANNEFDPGYTIDISGSSILYTAAETPVDSPFYNPGEFNGIVLTDISNTLPAIENVTLDTLATTFGIDASDITFTEDTIAINLEDISYIPGETFKLDVDFEQVDDAYEENDSFDVAYDLTNQENQWLSSVAGFGRQYDEDWYQINIAPENRWLTVDLEFVHGAGDIDIALYDTNQNVITSSTSTTDNESLDVLLPSDGDYYLRVYFGDQGNLYDLRWNSELFVDDAYEDNDTQATAYDLSSNERTWLESIAGVGIAGDQDWYKISVLPGEELLIVDLELSDDDDVDSSLSLTLWDANENFVTSTSAAPDGQLKTIVPSAGDYYIQVDTFNYKGDAYNLRWKTRTFDDDSYEDNDTQSTAYDLSDRPDTWLTSLEGSGVSGDEDWYQINVTPGNEHVVVDLQFTHDNGDLELGFYDADGNYITGSTSITDNESVETIVPTAGAYFIQVESFGTYIGNTYDLRWNNLRFEEDDYEDNDDQVTAYDLSNDEQTWLTDLAGFGVSADADWYQIEINEGLKNLLVDLHFTHDAGNLSLDLYNSNGEYVTGSFSTTDNEHLDVVVEDAGTHYLVVSNFENYTGNTYDLWWDDIEVVDDAYEDNDDLVGAYDLSQHAATWLSDLAGVGIARDEDWYRITIEPGVERLIADIQFIQSQGEIGLALYDVNGSYVTGAAAYGDNGQINTVVDTPGTYFLNVFSFSSSGSDRYDLRWETQTVS